MLIDIAKIKLIAGKGGDGRVSFIHEKYAPKGGPDGGDGGNGGSIYLVADNNLVTLMDFRSKVVYKAEVGEMGGSSNMTGKSANDMFIKVPRGTLVYLIEDSGNQVLIADLVEDKEQFLIAKGGRGGKGNSRFKSSTNQTPRQFTKGSLGEEKNIKLEIKMIADVGLIGMPNAGKSTLLNHLTNSTAKIGNYPFTTLMPNLGVCNFKDGSKAILADIPGLIEGASEGKGLGDDFLRHIERTRTLVHLVEFVLSDSIEESIKLTFNNYQIIRKELGDYNKNLLDKKEIVLINKIDLTEVKEAFTQIEKMFKKHKIEVLGISAYTGEGLEELKNKLMLVLQKTEKQIEFEVQKPVKMFNINNMPNKRLVFKNEVSEVSEIK